MKLRCCICMGEGALLLCTIPGGFQQACNGILAASSH